MVMTLQSEKLVDIDLMFRAFADPTRLRVLHLLLSGESCVGDIVAVLELPQPLVSRHLAYLRRAGLVVDRRVGKWKHYSLAPAGGSFHENLLCCISKCFGEVPELKADAERAGVLRKSGGCCAGVTNIDRPAGGPIASEKS
jgi:ArsR family transcriptional regulator